MSPWTWIAMAHQIHRYGYFPFVATVGGLVVLGADIVEARGLSQLTLEPPGAWFEVAAEHWLPTGRGSAVGAAPRPAERQRLDR